MSTLKKDDLPAAETWVPQSALLRAAVGTIEEASRRETPYNFQNATDVGMLEIERANGVAFLGASPHVDSNFERWFVMLTVQAPDDIVLHLGRGKKVVADPGAQVSVPIVAGEMLIFDAHRLHWVNFPYELKPAHKNDNFGPHVSKHHRELLSIMVGTEVSVRPTREEAEALVVDYLAQNTPKALAKARQSIEKVAMRAPGRRPGR